MTTSYNGWPASENPRAIGINPAWEPIPGHRLPGGVKAGDVETVLTWVTQQLHARVESIDAGAKDDWGYTYKHSANSPRLISCHASGTAFDWNATRHPNGKRGTFTKAQATEIQRILAEIDRIVDWRAHVNEGGVATGTPDEMHFEISQTRGTAAAVARVAARLRAGQVHAQATGTPTPLLEEDDDMPLQLIQCDPARNEWPEIKTAVFKTGGLRTNTEWLPTPGQGDALRDLDLAAGNKGTVRHVSPNLLLELIPDEFYEIFGHPKPTKRTHPQLSSPLLPSGS